MPYFTAKTKISLWQTCRLPFFFLLFISALIIASFFSSGTFSFFFDSENSAKNFFGANSLDIVIDNPVDFSPAVTPNQKTEVNFHIQKQAPMPFQYQIVFKNFSGSLCNHLKLKADRDRDGSWEYSSDLKNFSKSGTSNQLLWHFEASLEDNKPEQQNGECAFEIEVKAWQEGMAQYPEGYSDQEKAKSKIVSGRWINSPEVVINELMWMGSWGEPDDEWIELRNMTERDIDLSNWKIEGAGMGSGHIEIPSGHAIKAKDFFLITRKKWDETAINLAANLPKDKGCANVSSIRLHNDGEQLVLRDKNGNVIDIVWQNGQKWPAGKNDNDKKQSMQRINDPVDGTQADEWKTCSNSACKETIYWDTDGPNYGTPGNGNIF